MISTTIPGTKADVESVEGDFSTSEAYDILSDRRRRYAVHYLKQVGGPVSVRELAEQVAAWENSKTVEELDYQERKRVYSSLTQSPLSTMEEAGIIDHAEQAKTVELTDSVEETDIYLEIVSQRDIPWSYFNLGLSIAFGALLVVHWLEIGVVSQVSTYVVAAAIVVSFAFTAFLESLERGRTKLGDEGPPPEVQRS
jgi:predicted transcriptional regulator